MSGFSLDFPAELVDAIAERVAERLGRDMGTVSPWLDAKGAADYLSIPEGRVRNLTAAEAIPHHHQGKTVIYHVAELDEWARTSG